MSTEDGRWISHAELARLRAIEEAARWHLANSACGGWPQGECLKLALGLNPEALREDFNHLLRLLGHNPTDDPLAEILALSVPQDGQQ